MLMVGQLETSSLLMHIQIIQYINTYTIYVYTLHPHAQAQT